MPLIVTVRWYESVCEYVNRKGAESQSCEKNFKYPSRDLASWRLRG